MTSTNTTTSELLLENNPVVNSRGSDGSNISNTGSNIAGKVKDKSDGGSNIKARRVKQEGGTKKRGTGKKAAAASTFGSMKHGKTKVIDVSDDEDDTCHGGAGEVTEVPFGSRQHDANKDAISLDIPLVDLTGNGEGTIEASSQTGPK